MRKLIPIFLAVTLLSGCKIVRSIGETIGVVGPEENKTEIVVVDPKDPLAPRSPTKINYNRLILLGVLLVCGLLVARHALRKYYAETGQVNNDESQSD